MRRFVLGTAGHIDHGKTALIRALTGQETDRLPEEKRRGISIDLGFAHLDLPAVGAVAGIVDVPGHEKFIKNMVAGATGVDAVMLVVAADEGIMPQTREHLDIMTLLGVERGLVVLTKTDLVEPEWMELVREDVRGGLAGTFLHGSPLIEASAVTGQGLDQVRSELERLAQSVRARDVDGLPRLPIDRVFTVRGFGTVVTGTLVAGSIATGDRLEIQPAAGEVRVRQLEVHGVTVDRAEAGERVAVNLGGIDRDDIERGQVLITPGLPCVCRRFSGRMTLLESAAVEIRMNHRVRVHIGTAEVMARCIPLDRDRVRPGQSALVRFNLELPTVAFWRDRFIVRSYSPQDTIGGGTVIEGDRRRRRSDAAAALVAREDADLGRYVEILLTDELSRPCTAAELALNAGHGTEAITPIVRRLVAADRVLEIAGEVPLYFHREAYERVAAMVVDRLKENLEADSLSPGMQREQLRTETMKDTHPRQFASILGLLAGHGRIVTAGSLVTLPGRKVELTPRQASLRDRLAQALDEGGFSPPTVAELSQSGSERDVKRMLQHMQHEGTVVRVDDDLYFHREWVERAQAMVAEYFGQHSELTVAAFRDLLGTSRKYVMPLLGYFDGCDITRRKDEVRVRGTRTIRSEPDQ